MSRSSRNDPNRNRNGKTRRYILLSRVVTGVFARSFAGSSALECKEQSSGWVRTKGDHTTPKAAE